MKDTLKYLRLQNNLSQNKIADYLGISRQMYIKYELGETEPTVKCVRELSKLYKVSYDVLIDDKFKNQMADSAQTEHSEVLNDSSHASSTREVHEHGASYTAGNVNADAIVQSCVKNINQGYVTSHSICDFFYIIRKDCDFETKMNWVKFIISTFTILTEDAAAFENALKAEYFDDLEDQLKMESAATAGLDYVITENLRDFACSKVPAVSSVDFVEKVL